MEETTTETTETTEESEQKTETSTSNPTNPPLRDTQTARNLRDASTKEVFKDMKRRGMLR